MNDKQKDSRAFLGFDLGTSAAKAVVLGADGEFLAETRRPAKSLYQDNGVVEFDPDARYRDIVDIIRELKAAIPKKKRIVALSMAAASGNALLTDAAGKPLTQVISWLDTRFTPESAALLAELHRENVHDIVGWPAIPTFPLAHFAWLKTSRPDIFARAGHFGMDTDYVLYRLTGQWAMDHSTATTFYLQDQRARRYHRPFLDILGIPEAKLSKLVPSGSPIGTLTETAASETGLDAETLVVAGSFDHPAAARGVGATRPGDAILSCGTSWVGFFPVTDRAKVVKLGFLVDPFLSPAGPWGTMISVPKIGGAVDGYVDRVIAAPDNPDKYRLFSEAAAKAAPGAGGLFLDLRENLPEDIAAFRAKWGIANISRAVMESAAFLLRVNLEKARNGGVPIETIHLVGGPSRSEIWTRIVADATGLTLSLSSGQSAGAVGAAFLAGVAAGAFRDADDAIGRLRERPKIVAPDPKNNALYNDLYRAFKQEKNLL